MAGTKVYIVSRVEAASEDAYDVVVQRVFERREHAEALVEAIGGFVEERDLICRKVDIETVYGD